jgi:hypothetical protein
MALSTEEIESLRFHLGYGNIGAMGAPYTPDNFLELFTQVISPNLSTGTETSATTVVTAGTTATVTPVAMTGISSYVTLVVDVGEEAEVIIVKATTATTFAAKFEKAHTSAGYPVATMSGTARLRMLLWDADAAWKVLNSKGVISRAGIKVVDEIEFFGDGAFMQERVSQYTNIVTSISALVQVAPKWAENSRVSSRLEAY